MDYKTQINPEKIPKHIAIIMDGNGRWAKQKGEQRVFGHANGVEAVREALVASSELGVKYLTLYAFSTENWNRPKYEVDALMNLLVQTISKEVASLLENDIKLAAIGNMDNLPTDCLAVLNEAIKKTENNKGVVLTLALSYSSKWEICEATKKIAQDYANKKIELEQIDGDLFTKHLTTKDIPDPELLIRTSGEHRISNFLLWQIAYSELHFLDIYWPDFKKEDFYKVVFDYQKRERRFGKTSEQIGTYNHF